MAKYYLATVMSEVGVTYHLQKFNNPLLKETVYRQEASPEVDAAWDALGINCILTPCQSHPDTG